MPIPLIPDIALFQRKLAGFQLATYHAGECVLTAGAKTGRLIRPASPPASTLKSATGIDADL
jgi:hypothetical protein